LLDGRMIVQIEPKETDLACVFDQSHTYRHKSSSSAWVRVVWPAVRCTVTEYNRLRLRRGEGVGGWGGVGVDENYRRQRCAGGGGSPFAHQIEGHVPQRLHWLGRVARVPCRPMVDLSSSIKICWGTRALARAGRGFRALSLSRFASRRPFGSSRIDRCIFIQPRAGREDVGCRHVSHVTLSRGFLYRVASKRVSRYVLIPSFAHNYWS
jgi:hypothetical protein